MAHSEANEEYNKMVVTTRTGAAGVRNKSKVDTNICRHNLYGFIRGGDKITHKTERARLCTFHGKSTEYIMKTRKVYFVEHPYAKVKYYEMYAGGDTSM